MDRAETRRPKPLGVGNADPVNWQKIVRHLVTEFHLSYREVLDLTPRQIAAILTEKSDPPGLLQLETLDAMKRSLKEYYG